MLSLALFNSPLNTPAGQNGQIASLAVASARKLTFDLTAAHTISFSLPGSHWTAPLVQVGVSDVMVWWDDNPSPLGRFRITASQISINGPDVSVAFTGVSYKGLPEAWEFHDADQRSWGLGSPNLQLPVTNSAAGTLGAGAQFYVVTAVTASGETVASNEQSVTLFGTTNTVTLSWSAVAGTTSYRVYRSTTGGVETLFAITNATTLADSGQAAAAGGGTPPASSTVGGVVQSQIMWEIFNGGQTKTNGTLGVRRGAIPTLDPVRNRPPTGDPSTGLVAQYFAAGSTRLAGIQSLEQVIGGAEWDINPDPTDLTKLTFDVYNLRGRTDPTAPLQLVVGSTVASGSRSQDMATYGNITRTVGSSQSVGGLTSVPPVSWSPVSQDATVDTAGKVLAGRWERSFSSAAVVQSGVNEAAARNLVTASNPYPSWSLSLTPGVWTGPSSLWLGDVTRLLCRVISAEATAIPLLDVVELQRVLKLEISADEAGGVGVTVTVGKAPITYVMYRQQLDRTLAALVQAAVKR